MINLAAVLGTLSSPLIFESLGYFGVYIIQESVNSCNALWAFLAD